ncbi:L,D-transpeptidase family protein [Steroidobacter sp. S1-65]|uniref:L,D-transpeptidase family protein n=1 Tax=Steroidobacter gossypii TaxID=2805490 RepID=A0ABS1X2U7_9GAMM|nr:L,D-transpeptidase family protein [Steroidobacter gossypii]MBM0107548.1 L,D-transpeptidase family protein [Steroidobacter gossypii]
MNLSIRPVLGRVVLLAAALVAAGCQVTRQAEPTEPPPPAPPPIQAPLAMHKFRFDPEHDEVVGEIQITHVQGEDTLPDIARRFNIGYEEILRANPGVDPWLPGVGREIVIPTQFVLPKGPREGLVVNLAQLRVFYFPKKPKLKKGEVDDGLRTVITHPIGIGKVGWQTPVGSTKVVSKQKNPTWTPPLSVRKEHKEAGDPLPARVPPGPDNPLGAYKMVLGWPSYLIHGTNKPYGVGMRSSHGCIRFYPEDIADLYDQIPVGTKVTVVNQPFVFGWRNDAMYVQAFPVLEDDEREHPNSAEALLTTAVSEELSQKLQEHGATVDLELLNQIVAQPRGIAMPVSRQNVTIDGYLAKARHVENRVPEGATWNYTEEGLFLAEEFEAVRNGLPLPKKTPPKGKKTAAKPAGAASGS